MSDDQRGAVGSAIDRIVGNLTNSSATLGLVAVGIDPIAATVVGATAGSVSEGISAKARGVITRRGRRAGEFLDAAAEDRGLTVEELLDEIGDDGPKLELFATAVDAAARSLSDEKLMMLARAFAIGALAADDATVDKSVLMVQAIAELEMPHLRLVERLLSEPPVHMLTQDHLKSAWTRDELAALDPGLVDVLDTLLSRLESLGMIRDFAQGGYGGPPKHWGLTPFGKGCADFLQVLGEDSED